MSGKGAIWFVTRSLPVHIPGGMERVAFETCAGLARRGWEIDLVTNHFPADPGLPAAVRIHPVGGKPGVHSAPFQRALRRWAAKQARKPDLLFSVSFTAGPMLGHAGGAPSLLQIHGSAWREAMTKLGAGDTRGLYRLFLYITQERPALSKCDTIVTVGPAVTGYLASRAYRFLAREKIVEIPNGIDMGECARALSIDRASIRRGLGVPETESLVVSACRLIPEKGAGILLEGYRRMVGRDKVTLVLAGDGRQRKSLEEFCLANRLGRVLFLGTVSHRRVIELLRAADLAVQVGTRPEGMPLVLAEALSVGCPVLVSMEMLLPPHACPSALVRADPRDADQVASSLEEGIRLGAPLLPVAEKARDAFSLDRMLDRYEEVMEAMIRRAPRLSGSPPGSSP